MAPSARLRRRSSADGTSLMTLSNGSVTSNSPGPEAGVQNGSVKRLKTETDPPDSASVSDYHNRLAGILDRHDDHVRLLFHLEKFVSLVHYDPHAAKEDHSNVFEEYRQSYDLWDKVAAVGDRGSVRHTRKQLRAIAAPAAPKHTEAESSASANGSNGSLHESSRESRTRSAATTAKPTSTRVTSRSTSTPSKAAQAKPTNSTPRASTRPVRGAREVVTPTVRKSQAKTNRTQPKKAKRSVEPVYDSDDESTDYEAYLEPHIESYSDFDTDDLSSADEDEIVPRLKFNYNVPAQTITHPSHVVKPVHNGSLDEFLESFVLLDEEMTRDEQLKYVADQADIRNRISRARESGLLQDRSGSDDGPSLQKFVDPFSSVTHRDHLVSHAVYFARLMAEERKQHHSRARRISNMVDLHFKRLSGAEEKERKMFERNMRQLARRTAVEVYKKWKLAEKVVLQRRQHALEEQQRQQGKIQLNQILEHSAQLLEARTETMNGHVSEHDSDPLDASSSDVLDDSSDADGDDDTGDSEVMSSSDSDPEEEEGSQDENLTVDELKAKYSALSNMPTVGASDSEIHSDVDASAADDDSEAEVAEPEERALALYAEEADNVKSSDESIMMDSEMDSDDESEAESDEVSDENSGSLAQLLGPVPSETAQDESADSDVSVDGDVVDEPSKVDQETPISTPEGDSSKIPIPFLLRGTLRVYQKGGLDWLAGLYNTETNGILADEMGLGKTIQTISLLSYLACEKHIWGPHLIVVPTSVMLNWEMEFKRFAPGFKVLTYYGNPAQRKEKRKGWNNEDTWHVCITSYQLVLQDQNAFRRKRWCYMILDEAHNIKNFRSQRWQALLNFNSERRLLLTGTPLQNNLMELWSLLYFLMPSSKGSKMMPDGFANLQDFQEWFARPVDKLVEGGEEADEETRATVTKLHQILRPYLLRRLKADVEKQMPAKYEHIVYCRLSKRQRYLYDDFMSRAQTKETLASGNFLSIINCLMQLRKVCNHPDLFEVRPILTSLAINQSVVTKFEPMDVLIRKRLLADEENRVVSLGALNLLPIANERMSVVHNQSAQGRRASAHLIQELNKLRSVEPAGPDYVSIERHAKYREYLDVRERADKLEHLLYLNMFRCARKPLYGEDLVALCTVQKKPKRRGFDWSHMHALKNITLSYDDRCEQMDGILKRYAFVTPSVVCLNMPSLTLGPLCSDRYRPEIEELRAQQTFHEAQVRLSIAFPDKRLLQYDCGKLQRLAVLMRDLIDNGHRALIFTQMTRVLDILEQFLNIHGWRYMRLDGATKVEQRQVLTERFNTDPKIPVFILSTRSGGLGINLTGADTVIFYDSDWNPSMDKQCQDRCHRIGQTRDVHIYRFVSEFTIESNILRKATQKQILDNVVIQDGDFTTDYFYKLSVRDLVGDVANVASDRSLADELPADGKNVERALAMAEDADDAAAASVALRETNLDADDFVDRAGSSTARQTPATEGTPGEGTTPGEASVTPGERSSIAPGEEPSVVEREESRVEESRVVDREQSTVSVDEPGQLAENEEEEEEEEEEDDVGHVDDYMIRFIESGYFGE